MFADKIGIITYIPKQEDGLATGTTDDGHILTVEGVNTPVWTYGDSTYYTNSGSVTLGQAAIISEKLDRLDEKLESHLDVLTSCMGIMGLWSVSLFVCMTLYFLKLMESINAKK